MGLLHRIVNGFKKIIHFVMGNYPLSKYHFTVDWGGSKLGFSEVSGLSMELAVVEYRDGASPDQHTIKMPGIRKFSNLVLKRGVQKNDIEFYSWINTIRLNTVERRDVTISLLNENHEPILVWRVRNAWPCKYSVADLQANSNDVLIESIELAHEGLEVVV
jgi:phage tail-like protein